MKSRFLALLCSIALGLTPVPPLRAAEAKAGETDFLQASALVKAFKFAEARPLLERAAAAGYVQAMSHLGEVYLFGFGVPSDPAIAAKWFKQAADLGDLNAAKSFAELDKEIKGGLLDYNSGMAAYRANTFAEAVKHWEIAVAKGHRYSMGVLGMLVFGGEGTKADPARAITLWTQGAALGDSQSMLQLGVCYEYGEGLAADPARAIAFYEQAATAGNTTGMYRAALMHAYGTQIPRNSEKAIAWWRRAAGLGEQKSMLALGQSYELGQDAKKDYTESLVWYGKASAAGAEGAAQAVKRVKGLQGSQAEWDQAQAAQAANKMTEAMGWYEKAASKGNVNAMMTLAGAYETGTDVTQSYAKAYTYYLQAADLGAPMADGSAHIVKLKMEAQDPAAAAEQQRALRDRINGISTKN